MTIRHPKTGGKLRYSETTEERAREELVNWACGEIDVIGEDGVCPAAWSAFELMKKIKEDEIQGEIEADA